MTDIIFTDPHGRRLAFTRTAPGAMPLGVPTLLKVPDAQHYLAQMRSTTPNPWQALWRQWHPAQIDTPDT